MRTYGAGHRRRAASVHGDRQRREGRKVDPQCVVVSQCVARQQAGVESRRLRCRQHELERCGATRVQLDPAGLDARGSRQQFQRARFPFGTAVQDANLHRQRGRVTGLQAGAHPSDADVARRPRRLQDARDRRGRRPRIHRSVRSIGDQPVRAGSIERLRWRQPWFAPLRLREQCTQLVVTESVVLPRRFAQPPCDHVLCACSVERTLRQRHGLLQSAAGGIGHAHAERVVDPDGDAWRRTSPARARQRQAEQHRDRRTPAPRWVGSWSAA